MRSSRTCASPNPESELESDGDPAGDEQKGRCGELRAARSPHASVLAQERAGERARRDAREQGEPAVRQRQWPSRYEQHEAAAAREHGPRPGQGEAKAFGRSGVLSGDSIDARDLFVLEPHRISLIWGPLTVHRGTGTLGCAQSSRAGRGGGPVPPETREGMTPLLENRTPIRPHRPRPRDRRARVCGNRPRVTLIRGRSRVNRARVSFARGRVCETRAPASDDRARMSDDRARMSDDRVRMSEGRARMSEGRARMSDDRARMSDDRVRMSDDWVRMSDDRVRMSEGRAR